MLFALLLAAAKPAAAVAPAQSPMSTEAPARSDAIALATILNPEAPMIEMVVRNFEDALRSSVQSNPDNASLEKESPGITEALVAAASKVMREDAIADMPALRLRYASFYSSHFSPEETAELVRFYSSNAGKRLVAAKFAKIDFKPMMPEFAENPHSQVSQQHIRTMNGAAARSIMSEMSVEDRNALMEFSRRPVFSKLNQARGAFEQLEADIANAPDPALDKALDEAIGAVMQKFAADTAPTQ